MLPARSSCRACVMLSVAALAVGAGTGMAGHRGGDDARRLARSAVEVAGERAARRVAVVVGVSEYPRVSGFPRLRFAASDAVAMARSLRRLGYEVRLLVDGEALGHGIRRSLRDACRVLDGPEGTLLFYFSGHGVRDGMNGREYLVPFDGDRESLADTGIDLQRLVSAMATCPVATRIVIVDACSGDLGGHEERPVESPRRSFPGDACILLAADTGLASYEDRSLGHGVMTAFVLEALGGAAAGADGVITMREVAEYVRRKTGEWTFEQGRRQAPSVFGGRACEVVVGRVAPGRSTSHGSSGYVPREDGREATTANLHVQSVPGGATCFLDGEPIGKAPRLLTDIRAGEHVVRCEKSGYRPGERRVLLREAALQRCLMTLDPLPALVRVDTVPRAATVQVDGEEAGVAPVTLELEAGSHAIRIGAQGFCTAEETLFVEPGQQVERMVRLAPCLPVTIEIASDPPGATVILDGEVRPGVTPLRIEDVLEGAHELVLRKEGRASRRERIDVRAGSAVAFSFNLAPPHGRIRIVAEPRSAKIVLRGHGRRWEGRGEVVLDLPPGKYRYTVTALGYRRKRGTVEVEVDRTARVDVKL